MALVLKVLTGAEEGHLLAIPNGQSVTLGRSKEASYPFDDKLLSRAHCSLCSKDGAVTIQDLESRNGTFVNGSRISSPIEGDTLEQKRRSRGALPAAEVLPWMAARR